MTDLLPWAGFLVLILGLLAVDLAAHRAAREPRLREAAGWTAFGVVLALLFYAGVHGVMGPRTGLEFLTGYLLEKSLSVDNMFVFALVFSTFAVPPRYQHKILFWGILGALVFRGLMIGAGAYLVERFRFLVRVREGGRARLMATPLLLVLLMVESTDVVFAVDSIPAIFAVTTDPFIIFTSNVFAILGLILHVPVTLSLGVIGTAITASVVSSRLWPPGRGGAQTGGGAGRPDDRGLVPPMGPPRSVGGRS